MKWKDRTNEEKRRILLKIFNLQNIVLVLVIMLFFYFGAWEFALLILAFLILSNRITIAKFVSQLIEGRN